MYRFLTIAFVVCVLAFSASAQDGFKGKMMANGYLGYTLGFGDMFDDIESVAGTVSTDAGIHFGGNFLYGVSPKLLVGGEIFMQSYSSEVTWDLGILGSGSEDDSETRVNFGGIIWYNLQDQDQQDLFLCGGVAMYDMGDSEFGFNGGVVYNYMVSDNIGIFGMPRLHVVMSDPSAMMLSISAGVHLPFGN